MTRNEFAHAESTFCSNNIVYVPRVILPLMVEMNYIIKAFYVTCFNNTWGKNHIWGHVLLQNLVL